MAILSIDLVVLVPSYGRPDAAQELLDTFLETSTASSRMVFVVDQDDPTLLGYPAEDTLYSPTSGSMVKALNWGADSILTRFPDVKALAFMGDDHRPRTLGWDAAYLEALDAMGGTGLVYGNDLLQGARIPTQGLLSANIVRTLGYFAPPVFKHLFVDDAWLAIGQSINRVTYLPNVVVEHMHPLAGKAQSDENYDRVNAPEIARHDQQAFTDWRDLQLPSIRAELLELL